MTDLTPETPTIETLESMFSIVGPETHDPFKFLFYGVAGSGKTTLAATAPSPVILDLDFGTSSLRRDPKFHGIPYLKVKDMATVGKFIGQVRSGVLFPERETIIVDNVGELQKQQLSIRVRQAAKMDKNRDENLPEGKDYQANTELMRRMLIAFRDMDKNIIFTCHPEWEKDEMGRMFWAPEITPKFRKSLVALMDIVGYLTVPDPKEDEDPNKVTRVLQVHPTRTVEAKCRYNLPRFLENPTIDDILKGR